MALPLQGHWILNGTPRYASSATAAVPPSPGGGNTTNSGFAYPIITLAGSDCLTLGTDGLGTFTINGTVQLSSGTDGSYIVGVGFDGQPDFQSFMMTPGSSQSFTTKQKVSTNKGSTIKITATSSMVHTENSTNKGWNSIAVPGICNVGFDQQNYGNGVVARITLDGQYSNIYHDVRVEPGGQTLGLTIENTLGISVKVGVEGSVDDDVLFDGNVYDPGKYAYWPDGSNGAHDFSYTKILGVGQSLIIQAKDNGIGGGIQCKVSVEAAPVI